MILAFLVPALICVYFAGAQAIKKQWKNSFIALLLTIIFFLLAGLLLQSHTSAIRTARLYYYEKKVTDLEKQLEDKKIEKGN